MLATVVEVIGYRYSLQWLFSDSAMEIHAATLYEAAGKCHIAQRFTLYSG